MQGMYKNKQYKINVQHHAGDPERVLAATAKGFILIIQKLTGFRDNNGFGIIKRNSLAVAPSTRVPSVNMRNLLTSVIDPYLMAQAFYLSDCTYSPPFHIATGPFKRVLK